jgi:L-rhamnose-H+ transport protein
MCLILSLGAIIPALLQNPGELVSLAGLLLLAGMAVTIGGIVLCSQAAASKNAQAREPSERALTFDLGAGLLIAVLAGVFSCFPNVGMNYAENLKAAAVQGGTSASMAGNAAWVLLFTVGFVLNFGYCLALILRRGNLGELTKEWGRNLSLIALMAALWIGSFYLYGMGAARMGKWGGIIGWPLFISLAILVGNLWGLWRGEWRRAEPPARGRLNVGLGVLLLAMAVFGLASALKGTE